MLTIEPTMVKAKTCDPECVRPTANPMLQGGLTHLVRCELERLPFHSHRAASKFHDASVGPACIARYGVKPHGPWGEDLLAGVPGATTTMSRSSPTLRLLVPNPRIQAM